jgi:hypothetical protein
LIPSFSELTEEEKTDGNFTQNNARAHTASHSVKEINQVFGDPVVSRGLWPPRLSGINPSDFYLWGKLEDKAYVNNLHTKRPGEQKATFGSKYLITREIRSEACLQAQGRQFLILLQYKVGFVCVL